MKFFFDTETTGLVKFDLPEDHPDQPRLVQIGCCLTTDEGRIVFSYSAIIRANNFEIPQIASDVHGITTKMSIDYGWDIEEVVKNIIPALNDADEYIAHNVKFDAPIIAAELARLGMILPQKPRFCTMLASTVICGIPHINGRRGYKWPKLTEAYKHFFNVELKDNHDALSDVLGCKRIYFEGLKEHLNTVES